MIENVCKQIIDNLGATGLLVVGLYALLYRPLTNLAKAVALVQIELSNVVSLLKDLKWQR